jgi:hypothetical protein
MTPSVKLLLIKIIHTVIWIFFVSVILYIVYCGIYDHITIFTWIAIILVIMEGLVLLIFKYYCPLTLIARKYSDSQKDNFDIFLPEWLAKYNKLTFTTLYLIGVIMVLIRCL